jgi:hypothetical protein
VAELQPVFVTSQNTVAQLTVKADLDFANFTSYTQWRKENANASENLAQAAVPIFNLGSADPRLHRKPGIPVYLETRLGPAMDGRRLLLHQPR